jgi:hypothetical protein
MRSIVRDSTIYLMRRKFLGSAILAAAGLIFARSAGARAKADKKSVLFNGKTLEGWIQAENSATAFSASDIADLPALAKSIATNSNQVAAFIGAELDDTVKDSLSAYISSNGSDEKAVRSALAKNLSKIIGGAPIYEEHRFQGLPLSPATKELLKRNPHGRELVELNRMLLVDAFNPELSPVAPGWTVKDGAMASTGSGRGVIYTTRDYSRFRLMFTMRHISGSPDHQACVLIFCTRPKFDEIPLDALGGIQFQVPKGGHWDYRPGHNNAGGEEFISVTKIVFDPHEWSRIEIVADASTGTARMAVAQPLGTKAVEVLSFHDPSAGKTGPIAWQTHNAGLFDEYKDVTIETNLKTFELITA